MRFCFELRGFSDLARIQKLNAKIINPTVIGHLVFQGRPQYKNLKKDFIFENDILRNYSIQSGYAER